MMKYGAIVIMLILLTRQVAFSQVDESFEMGVYLGPNFSSGTIQSRNFNSASNVELSSGTGFSLGFIFLYELNPKFGLRSLLGTEFPYYTLDYEISNQNQTENAELRILNYSFQINYYILSEIDLILSYSPRVLLTDNQNEFARNISKFEQSFDIGLGYEFEFPKMKIHPEIRYSIGLSNIWEDQGSDLGQSISFFESNVLSIILSLYSGKFRKKKNSI